MKLHSIAIVLVLVFSNLFGLQSLSQSAQGDAAKTYLGKRGGRKVPIVLPQGDVSFADEVIFFQPGNPPPPAGWNDPSKSLGRPDYVSEADDRQHGAKCVTLGTGGKLTLAFRDNGLVGVPGPDLFVWEVGPMIEPTALEISADGAHWISIGRIAGATAEVDIGKFVKPGEVFHYVRLTDLGKQRASFPGADIDAVAAIGSAIQFSLDSSVLFDFNKATLKPAAEAELHQTALKIKAYPGARIRVEGYTDNVGTADYNLKLSDERAAAVRDFFVSREGLKASDIVTAGLGASRPVAGNDTEQGRQRNRRVEIVVLPQMAGRSPGK